MSVLPINDKNFDTVFFPELLQHYFDNGEIEYICDYGELGYKKSEGKERILFADWNPIELNEPFMEWLEASNEIEWNDEWIIDYDGGKAYRCVGNSYSWQSQIHFNENGELFTPETDVSDWIEDFEVLKIVFSEKDKIKALPELIDVEGADLGYVLAEENLQSGFHQGMDDKPNEIAEKLFEADESIVSVLFQLEYACQFSLGFKAFVRRE